MPARCALLQANTLCMLCAFTHKGTMQQTRDGVGPQKPTQMEQSQTRQTTACWCLLASKRSVPHLGDMPIAE